MINTNTRVPVLRDAESRAVASLPRSPLTVLVIDDDPTFVASLRRFLTRKGMLVLSASNGAEGIARVRQHPAIDVIVLDLMMPDMTGLEVCVTLKRLPYAASLPVILLTGSDDAASRRAALQLGVKAMLLKPVSGNELVAHIQTDATHSDRCKLRPPVGREGGGRLWGK